MLICAPLSSRAVQLLPFTFTLAMFSTLCQHWKGSRFKKGVCSGGFMPWELPPGGSWVYWPLLEGSGLPSLMPSPPCCLTVHFPLKSLWAGNYRMNALGYYNGSSTSHLLGASFMALAKHTINSSITPLIAPGSSLSWSLSLPASYSSKCANHTAGILEMGWLPLSFCKGNKLVAHSFGALLVVWALGPLGSSIESSFCASQDAHR